MVLILGCAVKPCSGGVHVQFGMNAAPTFCSHEMGGGQLLRAFGLQARKQPVIWRDVLRDKEIRSFGVRNFRNSFKAVSLSVTRK